MNKFEKCSLGELKDVWEKFGWVVFNKFEDYVAEVRKVESDLKAGKTTQKKLKVVNDEKIHDIQSNLTLSNDAVQN
ncbi:MAG: hypothetical protein ACUZ8H_14805 [Candidatus Anammoxibacter sp.]